MRVNGEQFYNDQWVYMTFQIPSRDRFREYLKNCQANGVPETACYYFQVDYELSPGAGGTAGFGDDTTTWQIVVQGAPVRLLR